ncbi:MAG TPA: tail fiber domain-containing protein [Ferruginibacter sp.]|nr:tail fiber domain-containing protein [Ferruginibacter sp.]
MGIGITNPTRAKLEVNGAVGATSAIFGGEITGISLQRNWPAIGFNQYWDGSSSKYIANGNAAVQYLDPGNGYMALDMFGNGTANSTVTSIVRAFTISNTGNIGVRTAPTNASLYAVKAGNFDGTAVFGGTSYNSHFNYGTEEHTYIRGGLNSSKVYLNDIPSGNLVLGGGNTMVGINSGNPTYTLEINQVSNKGLYLVEPVYFDNWDYRVNYYFSAPVSYLHLRYNGELRGIFENDGTYWPFSDRRLKTNINELYAVLDKIKLLNPSVYEMKDHNSNHEKTFGFIAQDVKPIFPELVSVNQFKVDSANQVPDLHGLKYTGFSVIAIKALQEQYEQIQALQKEQEILLQRLEVVNKKIEASAPGK